MANIKVFILDKRSPGGDDVDLKNDYNLQVVNRTEEGFEVIGTKKDIDSFLEDYAIPWVLLEVDNILED